MIWAAFLNGRQNSKKYCETLRDYMLPFISRFHTDGYVFSKIMQVYTVAVRQNSGLLITISTLCHGQRAVLI